MAAFVSKISAIMRKIYIKCNVNTFVFSKSKIRFSYGVALIPSTKLAVVTMCLAWGDVVVVGVTGVLPSTAFSSIVGAVQVVGSSK